MSSEIKRYRLRSMPSAHCVVEIHLLDNVVTDVVLQSYRTDVVIIDVENREITCTGTYSQSTRKHIGRFVREFTATQEYYTMKELASTPNQYKFLNGEDYDKAVDTAWSYLNNDKPLTYNSYQKYCEWCKKATAYSYYW